MRQQTGWLSRQHHVSPPSAHGTGRSLLLAQWPHSALGTHVSPQHTSVRLEQHSAKTPLPLGPQGVLARVSQQKLSLRRPGLTHASATPQHPPSMQTGQQIPVEGRQSWPSWQRSSDGTPQEPFAPHTRQPLQGCPALPGSGLHLPFFRFLHAEQDFFFFLASVWVSPSRPSVPPRVAARARRRGPLAVSERARASKRSASNGHRLLFAQQSAWPGGAVTTRRKSAVTDAGLAAFSGQQQQRTVA